jgi:hypothetical protein
MLKETGGLDSVPLSEAPPEALARRLNPNTEPLQPERLPDLARCSKHGLWFVFRCARCSGLLRREAL